MLQNQWKLVELVGKGLNLMRKNNDVEQIDYVYIVMVWDILL